jgi:hypothetical protein
MLWLASMHMASPYFFQTIDRKVSFTESCVLIYSDPTFFWGLGEFKFQVHHLFRLWIASRSQSNLVR